MRTSNGVELAGIAFPKLTVTGGVKYAQYVQDLTQYADNGKTIIAFDAKGDQRDLQYSILTWKDGTVVPGLPWQK